MQLQMWKKSLNEKQRFLIQSVSIVVVGLFINQMVQTVGSIALARALDDPVKFGEVNLLLQIFGMVALFLNFGFNNSLVYAFSTDAEDALRSKFRHALAGSTTFGILLCIVFSALAPVLARAYNMPGLAGALVVSSLMLIFHSIINIGVASFAGNRNFRTQSFFVVLTSLFSSAGTVLGVLFPLGGGDLLLSVSLWMGIGVGAAAAFVCWIAARMHRPRWFGRISFPEIWEMLKYGLPLWAGNIAKAFQQPFLFMIIGASSVVAVGHLTNASRITGFIGIVTWAFMVVTVPFIAERSKDLEESRQRGTLSIRYNNFILYPVTLAICLFPDEINGFLFGAGYVTAESATYIRLLSLGVFFSAFSRLGGNILAGIGRTKANFWSMVAAGLFVIICVPAFASSDPVLAVWIYTAGWAISAVSMIVFFYLERFPLDWWKAYGEPLIPTLAMGLFMMLSPYAGSFAPLCNGVGILAMLVLTVAAEAKGSGRMRRRPPFARIAAGGKGKGRSRQP